MTDSLSFWGYSPSTRLEPEEILAEYSPSTRLEDGEKAVGEYQASTDCAVGEYQASTTVEPEASTHFLGSNEPTFTPFGEYYKKSTTKKVGSVSESVKESVPESTKSLDSDRTGMEYSPAPETNTSDYATTLKHLKGSLAIKTESEDPYISVWAGEALEYFIRWEQADSEEEKSGLGWACNKCVHAIGFYEQGILTENALYDSAIETFGIDHPKRGPGKVLPEPIDREWLGREEEFDWPQNVLLKRGDSPLVARGVMQMGPSIAVRYGAGDYSLV